MPTTLARVCLLGLLVLLLASCGSKNPKPSSATDTGPVGPTHDLFPPEAITKPAAKQTAKATDSATQNTTPSGGTAWPVVLTSEGTNFQLHEPVVESWNQGILTARSVVVAQPANKGPSVPGSVTIKALTEADAATGLATLVNTEVLGVSFPAAADKTQAWHEFLRFAVPPQIKTLPVAMLESGQKIAKARQDAAAAAEVTAPRIIVSTRPAILAYIDGEPRYVPVKGTGMMGVLNTRVLLLKDTQGNYFLHLYNGWVRAPSLDGPWEISPGPPETRGLEQAARETGRANFLLGKADAQGRTPVLVADRLPDIIVVTQPTALIVLDGAPRYTTVAGTTLQYAINTSAHLFRDVTSGDVYVRVDGFWFRAPDINGPWWHVPTASLPAGFTAIPDDSPKRSVKASIVGGPVPSSSDMSVVAADPRTATLSLNMAGDPVMEPIPGTKLNYVANASVPVIQIDINNWYAVQNGVWFYATEATGPWTVTSKVPPEIYTITPSVPIYRAIHSRVMSTSTDVTYYGYPGPGAWASQGGAIGVEEQGDDYQYTPPSGMAWGWFY